MTDDLLDGLRLPIVPVDPRPEFAADLLRRITGAQPGLRARPRAGLQVEARAGLQAEPQVEARAGLQAEARAGLEAQFQAQLQAGPRIGEHGAATVRYFVDDLDVAVEFYCHVLDFEEELRSSPAFAMLYRGDLRLLLSVPGERGAGRALPDGSLPEPGGWNRIAIQVPDLAAAAGELRGKGAHFRTGIVMGVTVRQALLEDPSGNLIELFEPVAGDPERPRGTRG
jgi:catechol 2,3-dioxygenase-like lactoylglutathione lyase family enzyme